MDDALAQVITACNGHWRLNTGAAVDGRDPEGIHQVRVGLRRLRSALAIFKRYIAPSQRVALAQEAKWLLTQLGPVRDLDVFLQTLAAPIAAQVSEDKRIAELIRAARSARAKAHEVAVRALTGARAGRFAARLEAWIAGRGWNSGDENGARDARTETLAKFARRSINRRLRRLHATYGDVERLSVEELHDLRVDAKKVRYGIGFVVAALPAKRAARLSAYFKELQDSLGHLNDIDVAERTVKMLTRGSFNASQRQIAAGGRIVKRWHSKAAKAAKPETARLWRKIRKEPTL